jgi:membrane protein implicated in regulation of membrane protease activity
MDSIYLISLIVGGFFVLLSIFGGGDHESDLDADMDVDVDLDFDADLDADFDHDIGTDHDAGGGSMDTGIGLVDLLSIRALFLFAAFFGLTGTLLDLLGEGEPLTAILSVLVGLIVGLGGNYIIKRFAYEEVSSIVGGSDYTGKTARVLLPFEGGERGKILLEVKGQRLQLLARSLDADRIEEFSQGEEVVVVRMSGRVAEVVKPN